MSVAVIIPFYNAQKYVAEAIQSCLIQKEVSEIILVDDGSTDESLSIVQNLLPTDNRISLHRHHQNLGRSAARNTGMTAVTAPYFSFLDADDWLLADRYSQTLEHLASDLNLQGVYEAVASYYEKGIDPSIIDQVTMIHDTIAPEDLLEYLALGRGNFSIIGCLFRSKVSAITFDTALDIGEDTDWMWRVAHKYRLSGLHHQPRVIRRVHGENTYSDAEQKLYWKYRFYAKWDQYSKELNLPRAVQSKLEKSMKYFKKQLSGR